ncbi:MAG TPA: hypothetical protein VK666_02750 [Chryseolinea sp.]|jgi:hypothetical protein|nr:hypothetical protein [Chryseolinea sp.]
MKTKLVFRQFVSPCIFVFCLAANQTTLTDVGATGQNYANSTCTLAYGSGDFDMGSDFTYVSGDLGLSGNMVSGSLTFTPNYTFSNGISVPVASFTNDDFIPAGTRNFYSGSWLITITPSAERRIMVTWTGGGTAPPGDITINISYPVW